MSARERVYKTHDNEVKVRVRVPGQATPLSGVTRITCELLEAALTVDSDVNPTYITWQPDGEVVLKLGQVAASGEQRAVLTAYDPIHPNGQVLAHPDGKGNNLTLEFIA